MFSIDEIFIEIKKSVDFSVILFVLSVGEIAKKLLKDKLPNFSSFWIVFLTTFPLTFLFAIVFKMDLKIVINSYFLAFWLYPALVKYIIKKIYRDENKRNIKKSDY